MRNRAILLAALVVCLGACAGPANTSQTAARVDAPSTTTAIAPSTTTSPGSSSTTSASVAAPTTQRNGAIGAPVGGNPGGGATGSPFKMPAITLLQGLPVEQALGTVRRQISEACGTPTPCVTIEQRVGDNDSFTRCEIDRFEPGEGATVQRGSVVYIVVGREPCEPDSTTTTSATVTSTTRSPTTSTSRP